MVTLAQSESIFITSLGFLSPPFFYECKSIGEVIEVCQDQTIKNTLDNKDVEFDGLVIKVSDNQTRAIL